MTLEACLYDHIWWLLQFSLLPYFTDINTTFKCFVIMEQPDACLYKGLLWAFSTQNDTDSQFLIPGLSVKDG